MNMKACEKIYEAQKKALKEKFETEKDLLSQETEGEVKNENH